MKALKAQGIPLITFQKPPATVDLSRPRAKSLRRRHFGTPQHRGGGDQDRQDRSSASNPVAKRSAIFGMTPIVRDGKTLANVDVGAAFGKEFVDRAKKRFGIDLAVYSYRRQGFQEAVLDLRRRRGHQRRGAQGRVRRPALAPRRNARRPSRRALCRADQELRRPAGRHSRSHQGYHRVRGRSGEFAAQPDPRHRRHPDRRDPAGVPARSRPVAPAGCHHGGHEPPFQRRNRRHDPRQRAPRRTRHHGERGRRVPPQHDRGAQHARGAGGLQASDRTREEGPAAPDGRPLRGRRQERRRRGRAGDNRHAARGRRNHRPA